MKFFRKLQHNKLTSEERVHMRRELGEYADAHPVRNGGFIRPIYRQSLFLLFLNKKYMFATIIAALVLAFGGGVGYAAEQSLPGDLLYPVKVHVNEEVYSALAFSPDEKVERALNRVERRLEEAHTLGIQGKLTEEESAKVSSGLEHARTELEELVERLNSEEKLPEGTQALVHAQLQSLWEGESHVLTKFENKFENNKGLPGLLSTLLLNTSSTTVLVDNEEDSAIEEERGKQAAEGKLGAVTHKIEEVQKYLEKKQDRLSAEERTEAQAELQLAIHARNAGNTELEKEDYEKAFIKYQEALRLAQQAKLYISSATEIEMEDGEDDTATSTSTAVIENDEDENENRRRERHSNETTSTVEVELENEDGRGNGNRGNVKLELQIGE